jgi:hypothetical protein
VLTDLDIVTDLDEIIDFNAGANPGGAQRAPIDRGAAADLNVVADFDRTYLWKFPVFPFAEDVAEAVTADHDAGMQGHAGPNMCARIKSYAWMEPAAFADRGAGP